MRALVFLALVAALAPSPSSRFQQLTMLTSGGTPIRYGLAVPDDYDPRLPRPLVLALHPGGEKTPYYGDAYMRSTFFPGLSALQPIMVAPDCPTRDWSDPIAEQAVMELVTRVMAEYAIDRRRVVVTGFSLGGIGTWFMSSRHADVFTAAIVMAGRTDEPLERLATIPTYVIHGRDDDVVPFAQAERRAVELERRGRVVRFEALRGVGHYDMGRYLDALGRAGRWVEEQWQK